jgi:hypothetical protein
LTLVQKIFSLGSEQEGIVNMYDTRLPATGILGAVAAVAAAVAVVVAAAAARTDNIVRFNDRSS